MPSPCVSEEPGGLKTQPEQPTLRARKEAWGEGGGREKPELLNSNSKD